MIDVNFCRAPSHFWVGWCKYENGTYYASGNTLDKLLYHIKRSLWTEKRISVRGVVLASKQSTPEDAPTDLFSKAFKTKYWFGRNEFGDCVIPNEEEKPVAKTAAEPLPEPAGELEYDYYDTLSTGDELIVYGILRKEVARYKLKPNNAAEDTLKPTAMWKPRPEIPTE